MTIRVEIVARGSGRTTESELSQISRWEQQLFAEDRRIIDAFTWEDKRGLGFNIQTYVDDRLAGVAHVFARIARLSDEPILIGALGGVMTAQEQQRKGVATQTVRTAGDLILTNLRADLGVLLCTERLLSFYQRLGWQRQEGSVSIEQPSGTMRWPHEAMVLTDDARSIVDCPLDLCGLPF